MTPEIAAFWDDRVYYGGLTYSSHPIACAAALATIDVYREDDLIGNASRLGGIMGQLLEGLRERHSSVGAVRNIGLFGILELVRNRETMEPMAPFNASSPEIAALEERLRRDGLYTMTHWNGVFTNPPLCITEEQLREAFAIIDGALEVTDAAVA